MILSQEAITEVNENYTAAAGRLPVVGWKLKNEAEYSFVPIQLADTHFAMQKCKVTNNPYEVVQMQKWVHQELENAGHVCGIALLSV